jgi:parallel beta-helix repeat protein
VLNNDQGNPTGASLTTSPYGECNFANNTPGDCGEGIHLLSADDSTVSGNYITGNSGGVLLTDENGPADGDVVAFNDVSGNSEDCGVTVAGHHLGTISKGVWSPVAPGVGGVFNNTIQDNLINDNGVAGQGAGVLFATGTPGGAVYDNLVEQNWISGNGLAGVTVHSHSTVAGEDLNGNTVKDNTIGTNNLDGDSDFAGPPVLQSDPSTTGVIVATAFSPIGITIEGNLILDDTYGVWMTPNVTAATGPPSNSFVGVTTPIYTAP